ncbi:MAG TPA: YceI family protein [Polyangiales bacterium]|nr:YceI family protein [Polyangiales bacterium]
MAQTTVHVFTFKDGLLARLAHDLRLTVGRFELTLQHGALRGWFDPKSLRVDGVAHGERVDAGALSAADKQKIEHTITSPELLDVAHYPRIELEGKLGQLDGHFELDATLRVRGVQRALRVPLRLDARGATASIELTPSHYGVAPYKALAGAIRLQDRVLIRVQIHEERDKLATLASSEEVSTFRS